MATDWEDSGVEVDGVVVRYRTAGEGPPIVFVHGVYVSGALWHPVVERLDGVRCIVPTWPLGAHAQPVPDADVSARASARRIPALLEALDLDGVTVVANDTGGGLTLGSLATGHPGLARVARLVLTNCDSYEHFPPKGFVPLVALARRSSAAGRAVVRVLGTSIGSRTMLRSLCGRPLRDLGVDLDELFGGFTYSAGVRADAVRTTASLEPSITLDAVDALRAFDRPVLLVWGDKDRFFPVEHAQRLQRDFPNAELVVVPGARTFVMLDRPDAVADAIRTFVGGS